MIDEGDQLFEGKSKVLQRRCELNLKVGAGVCWVEEGEEKNILSQEKVSRVLRVASALGSVVLASGGIDQ